MSNVYMKNSYSLTHPQKRIWYLEQIYPQTSMHNLGGAVNVKGKLEVQALKKAINTFIENHDGIRLRIYEHDGKVSQFIAPYKDYNLDFNDFSNYPDPHLAHEKWINKVMGEPFFLLAKAPLFYFSIYKVSDELYGYIAKFHHIVSDGWTMKIMTDQICNIYSKLIEGEDIYDQIQASSYLEYMHKEHSYFHSKRFEKDKTFWNNEFEKLPDIPLKPIFTRTEGKRKTFELDETLSSKIHNYVERYRFSMNDLFLALMFVYLNKTTQQKDIVIGNPVLNRSGAKERSLVGMFTSTMPLRMHINGDGTFTNFVTGIKKKVKQCYFHQKYPYDLLIQDCELNKKGYNNLFQVCVNYYNTKMKRNLAGIPVENIEYYNGHQFYSLQLVIKEWADKDNLILHYDYKIDDYTNEQIETMHEQLMNCLNQILNNVEIPLIELVTSYSSDNSETYNQFNTTVVNYPKEKCIHQLFEEQADCEPERIAIIYKNEEFTYGELNNKANQLANKLRKHIVKRHNVFGIMMHHSPEVIIGILAILKAGGTYLPIDPEYPEERINYILSDAEVSVLLTNYLPIMQTSFKGEIILVDRHELNSNYIQNPISVNDPDDLAYIIYTSGSTGAPKGVMIRHQGLVNYIWWAKKQYIHNQDEIFALYSSLAFDLTVTSIFTPLINGNPVKIYSENGSEFTLHRILKDKQVHILKLTPSHLSLMKGQDWSESNIRCLIVGGEIFNTSLARQIYECFGGDIVIFNEYGPTETVVGCMIHRFDYERDCQPSVPIGTPINNMQVYILDNKLQLVPVNEFGEIYISGDGIAKGYLNKRNLTEKSFVNHPFVKGQKIYKTGDFGRYIENGLVEYLSRYDQQVKFKGYRIELGEVENYLLTHPSIQEAVVLNQQTIAGETILSAYMVSNEEIGTPIIINYLSKFLPYYMLPTKFTFLDQIPLTPNGKVDHKLLVTIMESKQQEISISEGNFAEKILIEAYEKVLGKIDVGLNAHFYHLGGDSIKAIEVKSLLREKGLDIRVQDIAVFPSIKELAKMITTKKELKNRAPQGDSEGFITPTPIISWFFEQNFEQMHYWNQSVMLKLKKSINPEWINQLMKELIKQHDSLRLNYDKKFENMFYHLRNIEECQPIQVCDLTSYSQEEQRKKIMEKSIEVKSSFDVTQGLLIKGCLFQLNKESEQILLLTAHHLVIDGVSWRIILEDFHRLYKQMEQQEPFSLPDKTHSLKDWSSALKEFSYSDLKQDYSYWNPILARDFVFPVDYKSEVNLIRVSKIMSQNLTEEQTTYLMTEANDKYGTKSNELMIVALARTIASLINQNEIVIELEGHGRESINDTVDITRTVGWFTSIYPVYLSVTGGNLKGDIMLIKEQLREVPNKGLGYGVIKYLKQDFQAHPSQLIRFNYLGDFDNFADNELYELQLDSGSDYGPDNHLTSLIDITALVVKKKLQISICYSQYQFNESTINRLLTTYIEELNGLLKHCRLETEGDFTPSDFATIKLNQSELDELFE